MEGNYKPTKGWDYEDDHDYDDAIDYAAKGMVYWYGKYYKKETIDKMYADQEKGSGLISKPLLILIGAASIYGIYELGSTYMTNRANDKRKKKKVKKPLAPKVSAKSNDS